jgi:phytoene/squalene synthetase
LKALIEANRVDQRVARYATFDHLLDYCQLSADPVGHLVLYAFDQSSDASAELSDHICSALQVIEHIQDVGEDFERGRIYMPQADFSHTGASENDLGATTTSHELRNLFALETTRAEQMLRSGSPLVARLKGWARVAVAGFVGGGMAQVRALRAADYEVLAGDVKASRTAVLGHAATVALRGRL